MNDEGVVNSHGKIAVKLPVHPMWYRALLAARELKCVSSIMWLAALSGLPHSVFETPSAIKGPAELSRANFAHPLSDHITDLNAVMVYFTMKDQIDDSEPTKEEQVDEWCKSKFIRRWTIIEAAQKVTLMQKRIKWHEEDQAAADLETMHTNIRKCLAKGLCIQSAYLQKKDQQKWYTTVHRNCQALICHNSTIDRDHYPWIVFNSASYGARPYLNMVTVIDPDWIKVNYLLSLFSSCLPP